MANFITCYDKGLQYYADFLKILVSANDSINNLDFNLVQFKNQDIVSKEYVLYLGEKSVHKKSQMFNDIYHKYGIHIGYYGKNAWLYCEDFNWTEKSYLNFKIDLITILRDLNLDYKNIDTNIEKCVEFLSEDLNDPDCRDFWESVVNDCIKFNEEEDKSRVIIPFLKLDQFENIKNFTLQIYLSQNRISEFIDIISKKYFNKPVTREEQYKLAIVIFYRFYLNEILNITEEKNNNSRIDSEDYNDSDDYKKKTLETE